MKANLPPQTAPLTHPLELRELFTLYYASIWRLLRRLGVREADLDDAAQEVFWVAARRLTDIQEGKEHSFLYGVAIRVASGARRKLRNAAPPIYGLSERETLPCTKPNPEQRLEADQARRLLDSALDRMTESLKLVFVLYELENRALKDIADIVGIPLGTATSRLRRARDEFSTICKRIRAQHLREDRR